MTRHGPETEASSEPETLADPKITSRCVALMTVEVVDLPDAAHNR
jgi:hypothetical protein